MEINIIKDWDNPLLDRREITFNISHTGATPSRDEIKNRLVAQMNSQRELVIVDKIGTEYGTQNTSGYVKIYSDVKRANEIENKHVLKRNVLKPAEEPKELSEEEPAAEETEGISTEEPAVSEEIISEEPAASEAAPEEPVVTAEISVEESAAEAESEEPVVTEGTEGKESKELKTSEEPVGTEEAELEATVALEEKNAE